MKGECYINQINATLKQINHPLTNDIHLVTLPHKCIFALNKYVLFYYISLINTCLMKNFTTKIDTDRK